MPMTANKILPLSAQNNPTKQADTTSNTEQLVAAKQLVKNDLVLIKPGEIVPADGVIMTGNSQLNEAMLSGEQKPVAKSVNDMVFAGTVNGDGNITVQVKQITNQSFLSQLIRLSEQSQAHKPKIAMLSDKIAQYFVAIILVTSLATAIYWQQHMPEEAFWITLSVLVATCPCALSLATPTGLTCATTRLNKSGIMIKGGHVMETLPQVNCFAFDKTGTLTTGEFSIVDVKLFSGAEPYSQTDIFSIAAALESHSEHPIAKPFAKYRNPQWLANNVIVHSGQGVTATINDKQFAIGKSSWLLTHPDYLTPASDEVCQASKANCLLMVNGVIIAAFYLVDKIREEAKVTLSALNNTNNTLLLSGDSQSACDTISQTLPIKECIGGLSAQAKMQKIKQAQQQGYKVAMTGDGVNDSPVLGSAHVSIAMGCGADITKSGADVILLNNKLSSINTLIDIAHRTRRIIFQNYLWAFGYNAIVLPLAVTGFITPYMAVIGMSASSILVISNSLRLLKK
jgi:Cu2+-exporting ATPase